MTYYSVDLTNNAHYGVLADTSLSGGVSNFSCSIWYKQDSAINGTFIGTASEATGDGGFDIRVDQATANITFAMYRPGDAGSYHVQQLDTLPVFDGNWHSIIGTYDGTAGIKLYFDGTLLTNVDVAGSPLGSDFSTSQPLGLGDATQVVGTAIGQYAYPAYYLSTLSQSDVTAIASHSNLSGAQAIWLFQEGTGLTAADSSGYDHTLTFNTIDAWSTDVPFTPPPSSNFSILLTDDMHFGAVAGTALSGEPTSFSISFWYKGAGASGNLMIGETDANTDLGGWGIFSYPTFDSPPDSFLNTLQFRLVDTTGGGTASYSRYKCNTGHLDGNWHNIIVTYDTTAGVDIFVDGVGGLTPTTDDVGSPVSTYSTSTPFGIGDNPSLYHTTVGQYAYLQVFYRVLSGGEIAAISAGTIGMSTEAQWLFTEGTGLTAADSSGNGNTLTFNTIDAWSSDVPFTPGSGFTNANSSMFLLY